MTRHIVFRITAPLASWGSPAVGEVRSTDPHPSKSAVFGLIAGALGIRREERDRLRSLAASYRFATLVDRPGESLRDYHTSQVPKSRKGIVHRTRRDELRGPRHELNTILSQRDYRTDHRALVCIWPGTDRPKPTPEVILEALERPAFVPYLGRKSCPAALPFAPRIIDESTLAAALRDYLQTERSRLQSVQQTWLEPLRTDTLLSVHWDDGAHADPGIETRQTTLRRDDPVDPTNRRFGNRTEHRGVLPLVAQEGA